MSTTISDHEFERVADAELHAIETAIGDLDGLEVTLEMGILTLEFPDGAKYVVNSHRAARQIWMAAELRAWHFDFDEAARHWKAAKSGEELRSTLGGLIGKKLGRPFSI